MVNTQLLLKEKGVSPNHTILVSDSHPLCFRIGLDIEAKPFLEFRGQFLKEEIKSTDKIKVLQGELNSGISFIRFGLLDSCFEPTFYRFSDDMVNSSWDATSDSDAYAYLKNRYFLWTRMFESFHNLTIPEVQGLIGELMFLKEFSIPKYGIEKAIMGWSGSEGDSKDYSYDDVWYEIKAVSSHKRAISISSCEQLDSDVKGYLIVYILDKRSQCYNGISLNKLVTETSKQINSSHILEEFKNKLLLRGLSFSQPSDISSEEPDAAKTEFEIIDQKCFLIDEKFPKIKRSDVDSRISKVSYQINLDAIQDLNLKGCL